MPVLLLILMVTLPHAAPAGNEGNNEPDPNDPCPSVSCGSTSTSNIDNRYTNAGQQLTGAAKTVFGTNVPDYSATATVDPGIQGAMSGTVIVTKNTPALSLVQWFPWLYKSIDNTAIDPWSGGSIAVQDGLYRGIANNTSVDTNNPVDVTLKDQSVNDSNGYDYTPDTTTSTRSITDVNTTDLNKSKCKPISIDEACSTPDYDHYERWARLQYDNCSNQYILGNVLSTAASSGASGSSGSSAVPLVMTKLNRDHGSPWNEDRCQPLKLVAPDCIRDLENGAQCKKDAGSSDNIMYDYRAAAYLWEAWTSILDGGTVGKPYYNPNGGVSGSDAGTPSVTLGASASSSTPIKGPAVTGEDKIINLSTNPAVISNVFSAGSVDYGNTNNCGTDTGGSCGGGVSTTSYSGKKTTLKDISTYPYERIFDPTSPFSPRWDWKGKDRDYTQKTLLTGAPMVGYDLPSGSQCVVRCAAVPVDILSFRQPQFDACMTARINLNTQCFWNEVTWLLTYLGPECPSDPNAYIDTINDQTGCHSQYTVQQACKTMFAQQGHWPPCSTKYDHPSDANSPDYCQSARQLIGDTAPASGGVTKCCDDLAMALTPLNTLKIRNTKINAALEPVPEGYRFKDYFKTDMPYMRWWDTGAAAGATKTNTRNYNPDCDLGSNDVLVGVGTEGASCRFGGTGGASGAGNYPDDGSCIKLSAPDALTSWSELKQYQMNTFRTYGLNCIGRHEQLYKPFSGEDGALSAAGGTFITAYATYPDSATANNAVPQLSQANGYQSKNNTWPLLMRGTLYDPDVNKRFPNLGSPTPGSTPGDVAGGLDNAQVGDLIYLTLADVDTPAGNPNNLTPDTNVMPFIAVVTGVGKDTCDNFIQVVDVNNGKFPDACANTDYAGFGLGQVRTIYKNSYPSNVSDAINQTGTETSCGTVSSSSTGGLNINNGGSCKDPKMRVCTYGSALWNAMHVYRPCMDVRNGSASSNQCPTTSTTTPASTR